MKYLLILFSLIFLFTLTGLSQDTVHVSKSGVYHKLDCRSLGMLKHPHKVSISTAEGTDGWRPCKLCMFEKNIKGIVANDEYAEVAFKDGTSKTYELQTVGNKKVIVINGRIVEVK